MFKVYLYLVFLLLSGLPLWASLPMANVLNGTGNDHTDSISVNNLNQKCWSLRRTDPRLAISIGRESLEIAERTGYDEGKAQILNYLGICYLRLQDPRTASDYFFKALSFSDSLNISIEKGYALNNISTSLLLLGEYSQALSYANKSLTLQTKNKNKKGIAYAWVRMSDVYSSLQRYDSLLITAEISCKLLQELNMKENSLIALKNIGRAWEGKKQYKKALNCYLEIANCITISKTTVRNVYADLARVYNLLNLPDQAIHYGKLWMITEKANDLILKQMANAYALKGVWKEAFQQAEMSMDIKDNNSKEEIFLHNKNLQILYETRETKKENAGLKVKLGTKNLFLLTFAIIIFLIGLLLTILLGRRNQQIRLNKKLNHKNEEICTQRDRLEEINQTKDKLFSIIAHDLRGPIGSTSAFLEVLTTKEIEFTKEELLNNLILLKNSSNATFKLLENLLTWALTQRGEIVFSPSQNDLVRLVQSNIDLFTSNAENKKIQIINELDRQLIFEFDYNMINTVMRNLINNAIKYTGENGQITISANEINNEVIICIKDTGIGMDDETAKMLFIKDINRIRKEGTKGEKGTGLGLILCKEFVEKHGGKIWVESEPGKGSSFKFTLPRSHSIEESVN